MTVCIAARSAINDDTVLVVCMDMMLSTDYNSAETGIKWQMLPFGFRALLAGPLATTRELGDCCARSLDGDESGGVPAIVRMLRKGVGLYKREFAESHIQSRLGISYEEFRKTGKEAYPQDLFRELSWEIKNHYSGAELIIVGFVKGVPRIFKISADAVVACEDFAVIGTGTAIGESALYFRGQTFLTNFETTVYSVFEAKRLAENAPGVGKKTILMVLRRDRPTEVLSDIGVKALCQLMDVRAPKFIEPGSREPLPADSFFESNM
jgi:hypothetical protein